MNPMMFNKIWLCDDDPDDHYVFREALTQAMPGALLTIFSSGSELLEALRLGQPDVLFLDINMPHINGLEVLEKIRSQAALAELRIIIYSISEQKRDLEAANRFEKVVYLVKPQLYQDVVNQLQAIFEIDWT